MKKNIPNLLTLANVICGSIGIISLFEGDYLAVFWLLFAAGWLDLGDGLAARLLNVKSEMGKELDSLADMVSFGALPGFIFFHLITENLGDAPAFLPYLGFLVTAASAFRLAKFNLDTRQTDSFIGVPTPANTAFAVGLLMTWHFDSLNLAAYFSPYALAALALISAYLLNAEWEMFSFKMKNFKWQGNEVRFIYLLISITLLFVIGWATFIFGFVLYVLLSIFSKKIRFKK